MKDPTLLENLRLLVEPATMGDPMRPLLWVSKSHEKLAAALRELGHKMGSLTQRYVKRHGSDQKGAEARRLCGKEGNFEHLAALGFLLLAATLVIVGLASALLGRDFMLRRERQ